MKIELRDYQEKAHELLVGELKKGNSPLVLMSTGSGKSKTLMSFIEKYQKHFNFVVIVKTRKLVDQLSEDAALFDLDYGVFMAEHDGYAPDKNIQVCSIDTIRARGEYPLADRTKDLVLIIDEADESESSTYKSVIKRYRNRGEIYSHKGRTLFFGDTATAFDKTLTQFDSIVEPIKPSELRDRGYLVDFEYYPTKFKIDYSNIIVSKGEWSTKQVAMKMDTPHAIDQCFKSWLEYGDNRQTLCFCINKKHAENFVEYVNNYYKKEMAAFVYDRTPKKRREKIYKDFNNGVIRFLVNVRIITRGVDIPIIGTILDMAPTLKKNLHRQKIGRGSRPNGVYKDCRVLDPCKNNENCGHFYQHLTPLVGKDETPKKSKSVIQQPLCKTCEVCFKAFEPQPKCPFCGADVDLPKPPKLSKNAKEKLWLEKATPEMIEQRNMIKEFKKEFWKKQNLPPKMSSQVARKKAIFLLIKKHGLDQVLKIKKSIKLTQHIVDEYEALYSYKPLGGLDI